MRFLTVSTARQRIRHITSIGFDEAGTASFFWLSFPFQGVCYDFSDSMGAPIVCKIVFTVTFPVKYERRGHVSARKMHSLATHQLSNLEIIQTIDHLFECPTCLDAYRFIRTAVLQDCQ